MEIGLDLLQSVYLRSLYTQALRVEYYDLLILITLYSYLEFPPKAINGNTDLFFQELFYKCSLFHYFRACVWQANPDNLKSMNASLRFRATDDNSMVGHKDGAVEPNTTQTLHTEQHGTSCCSL